MSIKPYLRLATFNIPLYGEIVVINGRQKLRGLKILTKSLELFERAGFNISLVPVDKLTTGVADANGTYNGLYGAIQAGEADTSIVAAPLRLSESIGQVTPVMLDGANVITTKRQPVQVFEGTLYDCLTTLGPTNNFLLGAAVALILIFLSLLVSKRASWNFFAQLMNENFVHFRPLSLQLTFLATLFIVRALFGSAYSTDVAFASPPKLINSLEDLAKSKLDPIWIEGDPTFLEFKEGVTKAHADVFNMGPKHRQKALSLLEFQGDCSKRFEANSILYIELFTSSLTKYVCKYKSSQVCSGAFRIFISKPFSRTVFAYVFSKNTSASTGEALKKYSNQYLQQNLLGNTFNVLFDEYLAPSPQCENEVNNGFKAVAATNKVRTNLLPWWQAICALIAATVVFTVETWFTVITFICSVRGYFWI